MSQTVITPSVPRTWPADPVLRERDQRLESMKGLVNRLGHDLNNFLAPMLGYVTLIQEESGQEGNSREYASRMEMAARKTERFVDQWLMAVRPQRRFNPQPTELHTLIRGELERWRSEYASPEIAVSELLEECVLSLDRDQWTTLIRHLLDNARFALAMGGALRVTLSQETIDPHQAAQLNIVDLQLWKFTVTDTGFGMDAETLKRACEPFFTTRYLTQNAGLGLTFAHSLVLMHGGQLVIESSEEQGTKLTIWLPRPPQPSRDGGSTTLFARRTRGKILLVEQDPLIREVLKSTLTQLQLQVFVAQTGQEAAQIIQKEKDELKILFTEVILPDMSGLDILTRSDSPQLGARAIVFSREIDSPTEERLASLPVRPLILRKPFTLKSFREVVETYLSNGHA